jgi:cob(I)alamin adenosyltransferase
MKKIDDYKVISTTSGDKGLSRNYSNVQLSKSNILFEALGNIDELSSSLGVIYHMTKEQDIIRLIQTKLQNISSLIATSDDSSRRDSLVKITNDDILVIEELEQRLLNETIIEPLFVLPGSDTSKLGSYYDLSRSITRRAERSLVMFVEINRRDDLNYCLKYLNRLSDLLFIYARSLAS